MNNKRQEQSLTPLSDVDVRALFLTDIVDLDVLQHLQDSFAQAFNMPSIIYGPEGTPITKPSCFTNFCALVRSTKKGAERCEAFDAKLIRSLRESPEPTIRHGCALNNMVTGTVPIIIHGCHLANWGIGQMINRSLDLDEVRDYAATIGVDPEKLVAAARTLIPVDEVVFKPVVSFLQTLSEQVSMLGFKNLEQSCEIARRRQAEESLQQAHDELEIQVQKRTSALIQANESLRHEIHEREQAEKNRKELKDRLHQAQKMEAIGLMAGGVAHDLNNILSSLTGYPELLLLQLPPESELRKPIEAIKNAGERAAAVVADLLTVARGVASSKVIANLNSLVIEFLDSPEFRQLYARYPQIQQHQDLAEGLPNIFCSPVHIKKCIMNLMTNAAEAIDESGSITVSTTRVVPDLQLSEERGLQQMEYVLLAVTDTGRGIPKESIGHIFEPFYTKKVMGRSGTGLGLTVVWNAVEESGGKIFVESDAHGTSIQLYFPVSNREKVTQIEKHRTEEVRGNGEHILVVDDEPQPRDIASQMLRALGYKVDSVSSGELAVEFVKENPVDLIVVDMLMEPGMDGRQTYEKITALYPDQKAIIVSGFSESDDVKTTLQLGAGGFIKKPYSMEQLGRAVKETLHN
jgi:signal transduction histidine kinase/ActR/RegA family two-component response regulator